MQLHPWNPTDPESPFFALQRSVDRLSGWWTARRAKRAPAALTIALPHHATFTIEGEAVELLDDCGTLWVTRESSGDLLLTAGQSVTLPACGRTVVQALSSARVRIGGAR